MKRRIAIALLICFTPIAAGAHTIIPVVRAVGAVASGTGTCVSALPAGMENSDLELSFHEVAEGGANNVTCSSGCGVGWTLDVEQKGCSDSPTCAIANTSKLSVNHRRWSSGVAGSTWVDSGDHQICRNIAIAAGTWDKVTPIYNATSEARDTSSATYTMAGGTTSLNNCLIFFAATGHMGSASTTRCTTATNTNLANLTEQIDNGTTSNNDGTLCVDTGELATAGAIGTFSITGGNTDSGGEGIFAVCPATQNRPMIVGGMHEPWSLSRMLISWLPERYRPLDEGLDALPRHERIADVAYSGREEK